MRKQYKFKSMALSFLVLWLGLHFGALADETMPTIDEKDIHKPIFVVTLDNKDFPKVEGMHAIYRIFVFEDKDSKIIEESSTPILNFWTDDEGSVRVKP